MNKIDKIFAIALVLLFCAVIVFSTRSNHLEKTNYQYRDRIEADSIEMKHLKDIVQRCSCK